MKNEGVYSIDQTKGVLVFLLGLVEKVVEATRDGNFSWTDAFLLATSLMGVPEVWKQLKALPKEWADLDAQDAAALKSFIESKLDLPDDKLEELIEIVLAWLADSTAQVNRIRALYAKAA